MSDSEILERIQKVYNNVTGRTDIILKPETRLAKSNEISSLLLVELIACIEEEFNIELPYSSMRSLRNVRGLIKLIKNS